MIRTSSIPLMPFAGTPQLTFDSAAARTSTGMLPFRTVNVDDLRISASARHFLSRAKEIPCESAAQAFGSLFPSQMRFQVCLDVILPVLESSEELSQRILASYILYSIYAPHPIEINPFRSALHLVFVKERDVAVKAELSQDVTAERGKLAWFILKILRNEGNDLSSLIPGSLSILVRPADLMASFDSNGAVLSMDDAVSQPQESSQSNEPTHSTQTVKNSFAVEGPIENEALARAMHLILAARERVLTLSEQRHVIPQISHLVSPSMLTSLDLPPIIAHNPTVALPLIVAILTAPASANSHGIFMVIRALETLPLTLASLDLLGRLLRENSIVPDLHSGVKMTVAYLIKTEVLGRFIHESIRWLELVEQEERQGLVSDDRFPQGVQNLCRFYNSLIKLAVVDPSSDADTAEMIHFSLKNSRFEEATTLYRTLIMSRS